MLRAHWAPYIGAARLQVSVVGYTATVRFVGETHFAPGEWVGVELEPGQPAACSNVANKGRILGLRVVQCRT